MVETSSKTPIRINDLQVRSLSIFFPCYNEIDNLAALTEQSVDVATSITKDYEIIIVDDGSSDGTAELADELASKYENVIAIHHKKNKGYGAALQSGFRAATKELVFYTDGDGQFDISQLPKILPLIETADIVSCYRKNRQDNFLRKINAFCWGIFVRLMLGLWLRDIDCAFKLYKRSIFDNIEMHSNGALIDAEILTRAKRRGYRIIQSPVAHLPRMYGESTGANISVILRAFKEIFKLRSSIVKSN